MMVEFKVLLLGYVTAGILALLGQVPDVAVFGSWLQYGALGLVGITSVGQLYIIVINQRDFAARMDGWEKQRHDDSVATNETLAKLRENCAKSMK